MATRVERTGSVADRGLGWASQDTHERRPRVALVVRRWGSLGPQAQRDLRGLVLDGKVPRRWEPNEPADGALFKLLNAQMVTQLGSGKVVARYEGAAAVALEDLGQRLTEEQRAELLVFYRGSDETYRGIEKKRPAGRREQYAALERLQLLARVRRHLFGSTLRGWAVARMLQPAEQPQEGAA